MANNGHKGEMDLDKVKVAAQNLDEVLILCRKSQDLAIDSPFGPLNTFDPPMGKSYDNEISTGVSAIYSFLESLKSAIDVLIDTANYDGEEEKAKDDTKVESQSAGGGSNSGGGGGSSSSGGKDTTTPTEDVPIVLPEDVITPTEEDGMGKSLTDALNLKDMVSSEIEKMSLEDSSKITDGLINLAKAKSVPLDTFILDTENVPEIRKLLLAAPFSDGLKENLTSASDAVIQAVALSIVLGEPPEAYGLNTLNLGVIYSMLSQVAEDNGISIDQLFNYSESGLLSNTLSSLDSFCTAAESWNKLDAEAVQSNLLKLYDGNEVEKIPTTVVETARDFVDYLSEETDIYYEDLLRDKDYASSLKTGVTELAKSIKTVAGYANCDGKNGTANLKTLFSGERPSTLSMDSTEVGAFKTDIDTLAKANNTTSETLLTDAKYADSVRDYIEKSSNCEGIGGIFRKSESSVLQNVARNIYNSKEDNFLSSKVSSLFKTE